MRRPTVWLATCLVALGCSSLAPSAQAGTYHAYSCQRPDGKAIPAPDWTFENSGGLAGGQDRCATDGYAGLQFGTGPTSAGQWTGYGLTLPTGLKATLMVMYRWHQLRAGSDAGAAPAYDFQYGQSSRWYDADTTIPDWCYLQTGCVGYGWPNVSPTGSARVAADFPGGASFIGFSLRCRTNSGGAGGSCAGETSGGRAQARVLGLDVTVRDDLNPVSSGSAGALVEPGARAGKQPLRYTATDVGSGVYLAVLEIDGKEAARYTPDPSGGCVDAGYLANDLYEFDRVQPCSRSVGVGFDVDTTRLTDGPHRITSYVVDAGKNVSNVLTHDIVVGNTPTPTPAPAPPTVVARANGAGGAVATGKLGHKGEKSKVGARYGSSKTVITGKLLDADGTPITGATVDVLEQLAVPAAAWAKVGTVLTGADGTYRLTPKTTASRRIRFAYASRLGASDYRTTREVEVSVTAGMSIAAKPKVVPRRGLISLSGSVRLEGLPAKGSWVEVQVLGKAWQTVATRRVGPQGTWTFKHRLKTAKNTTLKFRARLRPASDVPSAQATSAAVKVRVR